MCHNIDSKIMIAYSYHADPLHASKEPLKRTKTDSGMLRGMTPVAAAKATNPEPAGNEIPSGKRVCESPPVGRGHIFNLKLLSQNPRKRRKREKHEKKNIKGRKDFKTKILCLCQLHQEGAFG